MSSNKPLIDGDLKALADAYSLNNTAANRTWITLATLTVLAFGAKEIDGSIKLFGGSFSAEDAFTIICIIMALGNLVYVSAQSQALRIGAIYNRYLVHISAKNTKINGVHTLFDVAHTLMKPNLVRMFPIIHSMPSILNKKRQDLLIRYIKLSFDFMFFLTPVIGILASYKRSNFGTVSFLESEILQGILFVTLTAIGLTSILCSAFLLIGMFGWWGKFYSRNEESGK